MRVFWGQSCGHINHMYANTEPITKFDEITTEANLMRDVP